MEFNAPLLEGKNYIRFSSDNWLLNEYADLTNYCRRLLDANIEDMVVFHNFFWDANCPLVDCDALSVIGLYGYPINNPYVYRSAVHRYTCDKQHAKMSSVLNNFGFGVIVLYHKYLKIKFCVAEIPSSIGETNQFIYFRNDKECFIFISHSIQEAKKIAQSNIVTPPILPDNILDEIMEWSVNFVANSLYYKKYNTRMSRGILLVGPPGNGKTYLCRYLKNCFNRIQVNYSTLNSNTLENIYSEGMLSEIFFKKEVIFVDDIDIGWMNRKKGDEKKACAFLSALDGINEGMNTCYVRIFTTNEDISEIEEAFLRPGRVDKVFYFPVPDKKMREKFFLTRLHDDIKNIFDINELVNSTEGMSFSELELLKSIVVEHMYIGKKIVLNKIIETVKSRKERGNKIASESKLGFFSKSS